MKALTVYLLTKFNINESNFNWSIRLRRKSSIK
jgi:hypothetical protein